MSFVSGFTISRNCLNQNIVSDDDDDDVQSRTESCSLSRETETDCCVFSLNYLVKSLKAEVSKSNGKDVRDIACL